MNDAKRRKNDEFYTQYADIENELQHYDLRGKRVYCNCDDPSFSNFWKFFYENFERLGIKHLTATYYSRSEIVYKWEYDGQSVEKTRLQGCGDFRSPECLEILKETDVVITNPPFSLFKGFFGVLWEHRVDFLVLGALHMVGYRVMRTHLEDRKVRLGVNCGSITFEVPSHYIAEVGEDGKKRAALANACWYTTLENDHKTAPLTLTRKFDPEIYIPYFNYPQAVEVSRVKDIPYDYDGLMGVPYSFMPKWNPEQFEIVEIMESDVRCDNTRQLVRIDDEGDTIRLGNSSRCLFRRRLPTDKNPARYKDAETGELYQSLFGRVIIRRKT